MTRASPLPRFVLAAAFLFTAFAGPISAQPNTTSSTVVAWPHQRGDLAPDPAARFGVLPNGLRYAIQKSTTPPGQVSMRLAIQVGSMHEAPGEEGVAHFLEHMAFHGSTRVPDGEVMRTLERLGLRVGADTNASTSSTATVYRFDLAKPDTQSVDTGLTLLREIAGELTLDPALLDAERRVVLSEERTRPAAIRAISLALITAQLGDHPYARDPIGKPEVIQTITAQRMRDFYNIYYRPERAVLIVAGDIDPAVIQAKITERFADWRAKGPDRRDPAPAALSGRGQSVEVKAIEGAPESGLRFYWTQTYRPRQPTRADLERQFVETLGQISFMRRVRQMTDQAGKPFMISNGSRRTDIAHVSTGSSLDAFNITNLKGGVDLLVGAQRQLVRYGLTQDELDRTVTTFRTGLQNQAAQSGTTSTPEIAASLLDSALSDIVHLSPQQRLAAFDSARSNITLERVNAALRERFTGDGPVILYYGPAQPEGGVEALRTTIAQAQAAPVSAYAVTPVKPWPYTDFGPAGTVASRQVADDLGVTMVRFANGVRLTVKPTDFAKDQVEVRVRFGLGQLGMPRDGVFASDFASSMLNDGGLAALTNVERNATLEGKQVISVTLIGEDTYELGSLAGLDIPKENLELQLQLLAAQFTAPGWRTDGWASMIARSAQSEAGNDASPGSVYGQKSPALLHSGDQRWVMSTAAMRAAWKPEEAIAFIRPILETSPIEVIIVGDVTVDRAIELTAKTLGALAARPDRPEPAGLRDIRFPGPTATPIEAYHKGRPDQGLAVTMWPTTDLYADTRQYHVASVLADILRARAFDRIRNSEGSAYSPQVALEFSRAIPGYGRIGLTLAVPPGDIQRVYASVDAIVADLAANEVTADELARALGPRIESTRRSQRQNGYWLTYLPLVQTDPRRLEFLRQSLPQLESITAADVRAAARTWLVESRRWRMVVKPQPMGANASR